MPGVLVTDCDHPSIDIEREIFTAAGLDVRLAQCKTEDEVVAKGAGAVALLAQYAPITASVMEALPSVRVVGRYGVSLDNIDVQAARIRGIAIASVPDYCTAEVADHALGLALALARGIVPLSRGVRDGIWDFRLGGELQRLSSMQLGIIGLGRIGSALARRAIALGLTVIAADPVRPIVEGVRLASLDEVLTSSDIISIHVPLDESTRGMIGENELRRMKPAALLVNTSRGRVIDQSALVAALQGGHLGGAALDVLEHEPIEPSNPLLVLPNVVLTPHAAFYSAQSLVELKQRVAAQIVADLA